MVNSPILQMREQRLRKAKQLARGHTAEAVRLQSPQAKHLYHPLAVPMFPIPHSLSISQYPLTMLGDKTDAGIHDDRDVTPAHLLLLQPCAAPTRCSPNGCVPC